MTNLSRHLRCSAQSPTGKFCDAESHPNMPFPICGHHASSLWRHITRTMEAIDGDAETYEKSVYDYAGAIIAQREAEEETLKARDSFVYYVQLGDAIKIGTTVNVRQRMNGYPPTKRLLALEEGSYHLESQRHREFARFLAHGREWFHPSYELVEHINKLRKKMGKTPIPTTAMT